MKGMRHTRFAQIGGSAQPTLTGGLAVLPKDEFLSACGASGPLQLMIGNRGLTANPWSVHQPFALIGRDPEADVPLDHPRVDGYHAYLQVIEGGVHWLDLGSRTGIRQGDGPARSGWLDYPHGIGIGPYVIQLASEGRETPDSILPRTIRPDPFSSNPRDSGDLAPVVLEFRRDSSKPIRWRMKHILTLVGRSPHCKVRLSAPGVSPFHCSLLRRAEGMWLVNLVGPGGVTVNGSSIRAVRLEDGDELRLGEILIRVLFQDSGGTSGRRRSLVSDQIGRPPLLAHPPGVSRGLATNQPAAVWMGPDDKARRLFAGRLSSEGELSATMLALVLDQFGQMQRQFFDQFQQTTLTMFQALGTMHHEQMEELHEKLDSLHRLSEDLQAVQSQGSTDVALGTGRPLLEGVYTNSSGPEFVSSSRRDTSGEGPGCSSVAATVRESHSPEEEGPEQLRAKMRSIVVPPNLPTMNVHEWLIGRIAALEDEHRTCWQRILDLVRGK
jgi:pSer/pThr/pTyr-binding forkhead associated (FHA) protein